MQCQEADRVRFELTMAREDHTGFRDRRFQPLSHLSGVRVSIVASPVPSVNAGGHLYFLIRSAAATLKFNSPNSRSIHRIPAC